MNWFQFSVSKLNLRKVIDHRVKCRININVYGIDDQFVDNNAITIVDKSFDLIPNNAISRSKRAFAFLVLIPIHTANVAVHLFSSPQMVCIL